VLCGELSEGMFTERPTRKTRAVPVRSIVVVAISASAGVGISSSSVPSATAEDRDWSCAFPRYWGIIPPKDNPLLRAAAAGAAGIIGGGVYAFKYQGLRSGILVARLGRAVESASSTFSQFSPVFCCTIPIYDNSTSPVLSFSFILTRTSYCGFQPALVTR